MAERPVAIECRDVHKSFRIQGGLAPGGGVLAPFRRTPSRTLPVLEGISFDVAQGEFFGIVGRNGSGKSTLLKLISSIYRADSGRIRVAGRLAPFLELGVGFNPEMTAEDNVIINGVMMGLTQREARRRFDDVIDFAGLEDFTDLELKNYSSGMRVRLAFAMLVQIESDILLIDEVLAVGDAAFQQKCTQTFRQMKAQGRTIVLVTHAMAYIQSHCDRAMLINDGGIDCIGDTEPVTTRYTEINFERQSVAPGSRGKPEVSGETGEAARARVVEAWVGETPAEEGPATVEHGEAIELTAVVEMLKETENVRFRVQLHGPRGGLVFAPRRIPLGDRGVLQPGERFRVRIAIQNVFAPGALQLKCGVFRGVQMKDAPISDAVTVHVDVTGPDGQRGILQLDSSAEVERDVEVEVVSG